jgi:hypothetical protein
VKRYLTEEEMIMSATERKLKNLIRSKKVLHNKIVGFYIYNGETYHFKADLLAALEKENKR